MKISTIQAVAMMILDHSSYFFAGFAAASVQDLGQEENMKPRPKAEKKKAIRNHLY